MPGIVDVQPHPPARPAASACSLHVEWMKPLQTQGLLPEGTHAIDVEVERFAAWFEDCYR